jgi:hypothetical protein
MCPVVIDQANITGCPTGPAVSIRDQQSQSPVYVWTGLSLQELFPGLGRCRQRLPSRPASDGALQGLQLQQGLLVHPDIGHPNPTRRIGQHPTNRQGLRLPKDRRSEQQSSRDREQLAAFHVFVHLPRWHGVMSTIGQAPQTARNPEAVSNPHQHVIGLDLSTFQNFTISD